jgi:hypothetical protein
VRVATWNLERGGRRKGDADDQRRVLDEVKADVTIVTEPPPGEPTPGEVVVASPPERPSKGAPESWVEIRGRGLRPVLPAAPYTRMAVAAETDAFGEPLLVYGSVLPWRAAPAQAPDVAKPAESFIEMFKRVLDEQADEIQRLRADRPGLFIWAGDFNQTLVGSNAGGSNEARDLLDAKLDELKLTAWNASARHAIEKLCAIDLICGPRDRPIKSVSWIDPAPDGRPLSDHAGYVVEL